MKNSSIINIGIPIYDGVDSLDTLGAFQAFFLLSGGHKYRPFLISQDGKPVTSLEGIRIGVTYSFANCPPLDVLFVPGAAGYPDGFPDSTPKKRTGWQFFKFLFKPQQSYLQFLAERAKTATWVTGVCTGTILMAAAGLLDGRKATTHWAFKNSLELFPEVKVEEDYPRFVIDGNVVTGGGISSTIDCGLKIGSLIAGDQAAKNAELTMQYAPDPPFKVGNPELADETTSEEVTASMADLVAGTAKTVTDFLNSQ
jgi:transcriptional regulator GlxA family with amidase domain